MSKLVKREELDRGDDTVASFEELGKVLKPEKLVIKSDPMDSRYFETAKRLSKEMLEQVDKMKTKNNYPQFSELQEDIYSSLYKYSPLKRKIQDIDEKYHLNFGIMDTVMASEHYKKLRAITRLDQIQSANGTEILGKEIEDLLEKKLEEMKQAQEQLEKAQKEYQEAMQKAIQEAEKKAAQKQAGEGDNGDEEGVSTGNKPGEGQEGEDSGEEGDNSLMLTIKAAKQKLEQAKNKASKIMDKSLERAVRNAVGRAFQEARVHSQLIRNWGLEYDDSFQKMSYEDKLALINNLKTNKKLKRIAELVGRLKPIAAEKAKESVKKFPSRIQNVTLGNDLSKVLPQVLRDLNDPVRNKLFIKDFAEGTLFQYEVGGEKPKGKGPLVVCCDESGSMHGQNEEWAKAVSMALLDIARMQKRSFLFIHFDSRPASNLKVNTFLKTEPYSINNMLDLAEFFYGGGTSFEEPLKRARTEIDKEPEFSKADIIFITDGECVVTDSFARDFKKWKTERKVEVFTIVIDQHYSNTESLKDFSDKIVTLESMRAEYDKLGKASSIFDHIIM